MMDNSAAQEGETMKEKVTESYESLLIPPPLLRRGPEKTIEIPEFDRETIKAAPRASTSEQLRAKSAISRPAIAEAITDYVTVSSDNSLISWSKRHRVTLDKLEESSKTVLKQICRVKQQIKRSEEGLAHPKLIWRFVDELTARENWWRHVGEDAQLWKSHETGPARKWTGLPLLVATLAVAFEAVGAPVRGGSRQADGSYDGPFIRFVLCALRVAHRNSGRRGWRRPSSDVVHDIVGRYQKRNISGIFDGWPNGKIPTWAVKRAVARHDAIFRHVLGASAPRFHNEWAGKRGLSRCASGTWRPGSHGPLSVVETLISFVTFRSEPINPGS